MLTSLFFVVTAFIEFAIVQQLHRSNENFIMQERKHQETQKNGKLAVTIDATEKNGHGENRSEDLLTNPIKERAPKFDVVKIDFGAFVVGLLLFLFFNLGYWLIFSLYNFN